MWFVKTTTTRAASIHKVRREILGGKRADGHDRQRQRRKVRRPDSERVHVGPADGSLTAVAGLAGFGAFVKRAGVDATLKHCFGPLKSAPMVVYPMHAQLRLLLDANAAGATRVFDLEALAADRLFVHLAGGVIPSIDTVYRDLARFDDAARIDLEALMADQGLVAVRRHRGPIHLDIDTTVEPLFGSQQGALPGPNPRYHGRPSYHPILAVVPETGTCVAALLRPGDCALGDADAPLLRRWVWRVRKALRPQHLLTVRIDAGGDCARILAALHEAKARFIVKAKLTPDLCEAITLTKTWKTVDWDADGRPIRQVAEVDFRRTEWRERQRPYRVIAVRSRDRDVGKQVFLWTDLEYTVQAYITNDLSSDAHDIASEYDGRAQVEPQIGEFKHGWDIGKVPSRDFAANHVMLLIKLLAHNLMQRFVRWLDPTLCSWRIPWLRHALICVPGRLIRSGRQWRLRVPPRSRLLRLATLLN